MPDYQKMYSLLFNAITDALGELAEEHLYRAEHILLAAQLETERLYMDAEDTET